VAKKQYPRNNHYSFISLKIIHLHVPARRKAQFHPPLMQIASFYILHDIKGLG
jgi:hypothetical protein